MDHGLRILAATDLSAPARQAVERAGMLCKALSCPLDLLHVADLKPLERLRMLISDVPEQVEQKILDLAQHKLTELTTSLAKRHGISVSHEVIAGKLLAEINKATQAYHSGLLVCGAKGESFVRHIALGSTATRLLNTSQCPVLVVKQPPRRAYQRVLIPVDLTSASLRNIRHALQWAPDADVVLMHVYHMPLEGKMRYAQLDEDTIRRYQVIAKQDSYEKLQVLREQAQLPTEKTWLVVAQGDAAQRIVEQELECDCDLVVLGKNSENAMEDLLLGSVTKRVLAESHSDVLVVPAAK